MAIPFYNFPSSPILIIDVHGIAEAVFIVSYKISQFSFEQRAYKKALIKEQKELNDRLEKRTRFKKFKKLFLWRWVNDLEFKTLIF